MSDERFDKLIKKNLESVRPAYEARAWERFQQRLPGVGLLSWLSHYGGWLLSGLMLTGWITTLYTLRENQQVMKQLTQQVAKSVQPETGPESATYLKQVLDRQIDTVYVVKQAVVEHRHLYKAIANTPGSSEGPQPASQLPPNKEQAGRLSTLSATEAATPVQAGVAQTDSLNHSLTEATAAIRPTEPAQTSVAASELTAKQPTALPSSAAVQSTKQNRTPFRLSSVQPRVGIETTALWKGVGVGPAIELFPTENLGLSIGLQASQLQIGRHRGLRDFNLATGQEFLEKYRPYLPTQYDRISDISVQTSLLSLPLSVKYYVPLRKRWSLLLQTGTSFELAAYQQIRYESGFKGDDKYHLFEIDSKPPFFHNFMFGAGLQYRRQRLLAQLSPYYVYDFRSLLNTPTGSNVGARASVWLSLFK